MILLTGKIQPKLRISGYKLISLFILLTWILNACQPRWEIDNPYESVDWAVFTPHKANFHTHTTRSDGRMNPQSVVDKYHSYGYTILALTDHNEVTWPWTKFSEMSTSNRSRQRLAGGQLTPADTTYEDRQPEMLGMLAIQGNELSRHHHMGSFFNDHNGTVTEEESLVSTAAKNGITTFMHPGRYKFPTEWYTDFYKRYPHLVGLEIYNQGDRYPNDRQLWDSILTVLMPDRKVWGFSNDDMHGESALGRNWSVMLLPELNDEWVRKSMVDGHFYYVYAPDGHEGPKPPEITSIAVKPGKATIEISTVSCDSVRWISEGRIIHRGNLIKLKNHPEIGGYVRAELYGQGKSVAGTQPFGLRKRK